MRHPHRIPSILAIAALLAACAPADEPAEGAQDVDTAAAPPDMADPEPMPEANAVITLSLRDGAIVVDPDSIAVERGAMVRWDGGEDEVWIVAFANGTPFRNGRPVFNGGGGPGNPNQGPIDRAAPTEAYKYWVFYPDGQGGYLQLDPKLVVIEDRGTGGSDTLSR